MVVNAPPPTTPTEVKPKALNCPNCGAALVVRSFEHAVTIVCQNCQSILDAKDPNLLVLQQFHDITTRDAPLIPLGAKGKIRGTEYQVIGFQRRTITVEGEDYSWHEYLLFNPFKGFRYLTEYNGHWNDVSTLRALPDTTFAGATVEYLGESYKHFQTADARTTYVLGEFPWQVRVGETATVTDYINPPRVISSEKTQDEINWSMGEYMTGGQVWAAFRLPGSPPHAFGVYENQPSPMSANVKALWKNFFLLAAGALLLLIAMSVISRDDVVFDNTYFFRQTPGENSFVTDTFMVNGHTSNIEVNTSTDVSNQWIYLNYALINDQTGEAWDFGREVSYYSGYDSDGSWTEGSRKDSAVVPSIPPGRYYLRIEPETDAAFRGIQYRVTVKRDVPQFSWFGIALLALLVPVGLLTWRSMSFEHRRWAESDAGDTGLIGVVSSIVEQARENDDDD